MLLTLNLKLFYYENFNEKKIVKDVIKATMAHKCNFFVQIHNFFL